MVNNSITINNGTFKSSITGGITCRRLYRSRTGNAVGNTVTINGGTVTHGLDGGYNILGGSSRGGNSINN
ncbi:MAG: hypothetical protein LBG23_00815 [Endomicrobium sp.]|nr:hypothetical protein [Endomicrobium sp.]